MGPDLLLLKEPDHQFMELSPEPANTATDTKARKMVVFSFHIVQIIYLKLYVVLYVILYLFSLFELYVDRRNKSVLKEGSRFSAQLNATGSVVSKQWPSYSA